MADVVDTENHEAKKNATGHLEKILDTIEDAEGVPEIDNDDFKETGTIKDEEKEKFRDAVEDEIDRIQAALNRNDVVKADCIMRRLRKTLNKKMNKDSGRRKTMVKALHNARKEKRKITAPLIVSDVGAGNDGLVIGDNTMTAEMLGADPGAIGNMPISALSEFGAGEIEVLESALGIKTIEGLATHPIIANAVNMMQMAKRQKRC